MKKNKKESKINKWETFKSSLLEGALELVFFLVILVIGLLIMWLFSLKKDISNIPFEIFLMLGFCVVILGTIFMHLSIISFFSSEDNVSN